MVGAVFTAVVVVVGLVSAGVIARLVIELYNIFQ